MISTVDYSDLAMFAGNLARDAGKQLMSQFHPLGNQLMTRKGDNPQTPADLASNKIILEAISHSFPSHAVKSEEIDDHPAFFWNYKSDYVWIIDPCDGTINYMSGIPLFSVSIALSYKMKVIIGIVYDPYRDEMFCAQQGKGATLNGIPLTVGQKTNLAEATFGIDIYHDPDLINTELLLLKALATKVRVVRSFFSGALELSYLACGRIDIRIDDSYKPWDLAAASLIALEAGAKITDIKCKNWTLRSRSLLASNSTLHSLVCRELSRQ